MTSTSPCFWHLSSQLILTTAEYRHTFPSMCDFADCQMLHYQVLFKKKKKKKNKEIVNQSFFFPTWDHYLWSWWSILLAIGSNCMLSDMSSVLQYSRLKTNHPVYFNTLAYICIVDRCSRNVLFSYLICFLQSNFNFSWILQRCFEGNIS